MPRLAALLIAIAHPQGSAWAQSETPGDSDKKGSVQDISPDDSASGHTDLVIGASDDGSSKWDALPGSWSVMKMLKGAYPCLTQVTRSSQSC